MELMKSLLKHLNEDIEKRREYHRRMSFYQSHEVQKSDLTAATISAMEGVAKAVEKAIEENTYPVVEESRWT